MKLSVVFVAVVLSAVTANASALHNHHALIARHPELAERAANNGTSPNEPAIKKVKRRRCGNGVPKKSAAPENNLVPTTSKKPASSTKAPAQTSAPKSNSGSNGGSNNNKNNNNNGGSKNNGGGGGGGGGLLWRDSCGGSRPTAETTKVSGPNGHIDWLNCGLEGGGWKPPHVTVQDLNVMSLSQALKNPRSPYHNCNKFIWLFEKYGNQLGIPPIMLAAIAMQESYCRPETVGGGGEQGLMQITHDKCGEAPGGNCKDPEYNIRTGARYLAGRLAAYGGNVLLAVGAYNGWYEGLTKEKACAARYTSCCRCQNNLDYLHQFVNGWCRNINAYDQNNRLGRHFNLDVCGK